MNCSDWQIKGLEVRQLDWFKRAQSISPQIIVIESHEQIIPILPSRRIHRDKTRWQSLRSVLRCRWHGRRDNAGGCQRGKFFLVHTLLHLLLLTQIYSLLDELVWISFYNQIIYSWLWCEVLDHSRRDTYGRPSYGRYNLHSYPSRAHQTQQWASTCHAWTSSGNHSCGHLFDKGRYTEKNCDDSKTSSISIAPRSKHCLSSVQFDHRWPAWRDANTNSFYGYTSIDDTA